MSRAPITPRKPDDLRIVEAEPFVMPEASAREFTDAECDEFVHYAVGKTKAGDWPLRRERAIAREALTQIEAARRTK